MLHWCEGDKWIHTMPSKCTEPPDLYFSFICHRSMNIPSFKSRSLAVHLSLLLWDSNYTMINSLHIATYITLQREKSHILYPWVLLPEGLGHKLNRQMSFDEARRRGQIISQLCPWKWKIKCGSKLKVSLLSLWLNKDIQ